MPSLASADTALIRRSDAKPMLAWIATSAAALALGAAGFAHGKLWSHETDIRVLQEKAAGMEKRLDSIDAKLDKILEELRRARP